jgi:putative transposon-encoded protein
MSAKHKLIEQTSLTVSGITGFFEGKVTPIGNGAKIGCPKEYIGRKVYVIVLKE